MELLPSMTNQLATLGRFAINPIEHLGRVMLFFLKALAQFPMLLREPYKVIEQVYFIGAKSIIVVSLTGVFTGMVLGFQGYHTLVKFGSDGLLGAVVALTLIREMGPVLTAIMVVARGGSAIAAEIGIMRISEQIDALETMDINPIRFLVSPRLIAALISFPLLTALFDTLGILGGYVTGSILLATNPGIYFSRAETSVEMADVTGGFIKAVSFAALVTTICCFNGYYTHMRAGGFGAKGVGMSTTAAVVTSCVLILVLDYVLTSFLM